MDLFYRFHKLLHIILQKDEDCSKQRAKRHSSALYVHLATSLAATCPAVAYLTAAKYGFQLLFLGKDIFCKNSWN